MSGPGPSGDAVTNSVIAQRPSARCTMCGILAVMHTCHRCLAPLCRRHARTEHATWRQAIADRWRESRPRSAPRSKPPAGGARTRWCPRCAGQQPGTDPELVAVAVTAAVGVAAWVSSAIWLAVVLCLVVVIRVVLMVKRHLWQRKRRRRESPRLRLFPRFRLVQVTELVSGRFELDGDRGFSTTVTAERGAVTIGALFSTIDRKEVSRYRHRHHIDQQTAIAFTAGSFVLTGQVGIAFTDTAVAREVAGGRAVRLRSSTGDHPFFAEAGPRDRGVWTATFPYEVIDPTGDAPRSLPIWITPGVVPESDCRALELDIQWRELDPLGSRAALRVIEKLVVVVPADWGAVQSATPAVTTRLDHESGGRRIEWRILRPDPDGRHRLPLSVRFENRIDLGSRISGDLAATFAGTLSGIRRAIVFDANGNRSKPGSGLRPTTRVEVDFSLDLSGLRYQDVEVVSGKVLDLHRSIPDHHTIVRLTDRLGEDDYYVKRVLENPPRGGRRPNTVNRYWDIAGRQYDGIFPIEFHIILTGEEEHDGGPRARCGRLSVQLITQGSFANEKMRRKVHAAWDRLAARIRRCLDEGGPDAEPDETAVPTGDEGDVLEGRVNRAVAALHQLRVEMQDGMRTEPDRLYDEVLRRVDEELLPLLRGEM